MADDDFAGAVQIIQRVHENFGVVVEVPVVGKCNRARVNHIAHFSEFLPRLIFRNGADNFDIDNPNVGGALNH